MGRIFKIVALVVGAICVLFAGVLIAVGLLFDPNDYKDDIAAAVGDATGRTLTLEGSLSLSVFPRISIALGGAELSNAQGFGDAPFARFDGAELRVGLLPLLSRRIEVDHASLSGLRLNLARNAQGATNWGDLGGNAQAPATTDDAADAVTDRAALDISVGSIAIADAEVTWRDATTGQDWTLSEFNLEASEFDPGRPFPLSIAFELAGADVTVAVESEMRASVTLASNLYRLDDLNVTIAGSGPGWPGGEGEAELSFSSFVASLDEQSLLLEGLHLEMLGLTVDGNLTGTNVIDSPSLEGGIEIGRFDPRELMAVFDTAIETADPDVLGRASASAQFYYSETAMGMRQMALALDDSTLTGSAGVRGGRFEFDLDVDAINIDRYLPPAAAEEDAPPDEGSVDEIDLPIDPLRNFTANGNLSLAETQFLGMTFTDANFGLTAGNGRLALTPTGRLYGGTLDGEIVVQVQGDAARLSLRQALAGVDIAGVGRDLFKTEALAGTGNIDINLAATGSKVGAILQGLDGRASIVFTDGAWIGIDVWRSIRQAYALTGGPEVEPLQGQARTDFERIAIAGNVEDSLLTTDEFGATLPFAALTGSGTVHLLTNALNLRAGAQLVDGDVLQQVPAIAQYAGATLPLTIAGSLDAPDIGVDFRAMIGERARQEVQEEVDEAVDEAREEVQERLRDRVRGIFDR